MEHNHYWLNTKTQPNVNELAFAMHLAIAD